MLEFPEGYFEEEVRDGFTVHGMVKRAWAAQLEILQRIIDICSKHGLTYYACWGTLLGTIRHKGFIPWDDDVDIALKREDYMRLLEAAKTELPAEYCILSCYTEEEWDNSFMRITNGRTIDVSDQRFTQYHGFPFVAGIDIYPLDYLPRDPQAAEMQMTLLEAVGDVASILDFVEEQKMVGGLIENPRAVGIPVEELTEAVQSLEEGLAVLEECFKTVIDRKQNVKSQLLKLYDQVCMMYGDADGDMLASFPNYIKNRSCGLKKEWFADTVQMPFENIMITVPQGYDEFLNLAYRNYMTPVRRRAGHDYPFYKNQLDLLVDHKGQYINCGDIGRAAVKEKVILYHINMEHFFEQPSRTVAKIKYVLHVFQNNPNVRLWWHSFTLNEIGDKYARKLFPKEYKEYREIVENYRTQKTGVFDSTEDFDRAINLSDAYYGDEGILLERYKKTGKHVMVQDYNIIAD